MQSQRLQCLVPFCTRSTTPKGFDEWICGTHWAATPAVWRRRYRLFVRRRRLDLAARTWSRLKRAAIERAMGI